MPTSQTPDVIVVGAGLSGLTAALLLEQRGRSVTVLEASGEVGGRTRSRLLDGRVVDVGGELVGDHYRHVHGLVRGLGLHLEPTARRPRLLLHSQLRGALRPTGVVDLVRVERRMRRLIADLDPTRPWAHPRASELDATSVATWLGENTRHPGARRLIDVATAAFSTADPRELSMLHLLVWLHPARGLSAAYRESRWRVREGAQEISRRLAERLQGRIHLDTPIRAIDHSSDDVRLTAADGRAWRARQVALCVPLAASHRVEFDPPLDEQQRRLIAEVRTPPLTKVVLTPRPGHTRAILAVGDPRLRVASLDADHGLGFGYGEDAYDSEDVVGRLTSTLRLAPSEVAGVIAQRWHDEPHVLGGYPAFAPHQLTDLGPALRASTDRLHFGGGDRSIWPGTMEGAVVDGHRLARVIAGE